MVSQYLQRAVRDRLSIARDLSKTYGESWPVMSTIADGLEVMFAVTRMEQRTHLPVFVHTSNYARTLTGYWPNELVGRDPNFLRDRDADPAVGHAFMLALQEDGEAEMRVLNQRKDGETYGCHILGIRPHTDAPPATPVFFAFLAECNPADCA